MKLLEAKDVRKSYNGILVLDIPFLSFEEGKVYCLMGPNGAGKTTLLKIFNLIEWPDQGEVYYDGERVQKRGRILERIRREMTMLLQSPLLFNTTVYQNVAYGLRMRTVKRSLIPERVRSSLRLVGLEGFEGRRARELSGGEEKRVALARALAVAPRVLLLDEPFANVDLQSRRVLDRIIHRMGQDSKTTVIFTTHNPNRAYHLAHKVITLYRGRVVRSSYENLFYGQVSDEVIDGIRLFDTGKSRIKVATDAREVRCISINPEDIIVSKEPIHSSAGNSFFGTITGIGEAPPLVILTVQSGEEFKVSITRQSFKEMGLTLGSEVYLTFKISSVGVF
ncbi:MAG: ABC transporter ATP-binding protein [Deltaproteobacteria bacterium]|nr:ABC transporter ATP-binding protein [Deltaproteobacteria bacterium]